MKISITTSTFAKYDRLPLDLLSLEGIEYSLNPYKRKLSEVEVIEVSEGVDGIIAGTEPLNEHVFKCLPKLKIISRCGVGIDNIDLDAVKKRKIRVFNTPYGPTLAVAELTVCLIFNLMRNVTRMDGELRSGKWNKRMGNLLNGKKIGIVGFGRIGKQVAQLLQPFGVEIRFYDIIKNLSDSVFQYQDLMGLLSWADIISLHLSDSEGNKYIFSDREFGKMKKGAWFVNVARGGIVDESALCSALEEGHLAGAAVDVFEEEPYYGALINLDNVILTPHIGSYAMEARTMMEMQAAENMIKGLREFMTDFK